MNRKIPVSIALAITIIAMTITFSITWIVSMHTFDNTMSAVTRLQAQFAKLAEIDSYVRNNFYGEIDDDYLFDRVAMGYINGLGDKYSAYYTREEFAEMVEFEEGKIVGIGIEVVRDADNSFRVVRVYDGSPAADAGMVAGCRIVMVDGEDVKNISSVKRMTSKLRGRPGTELTIECIFGAAEEQAFTIYRRENYTAPTVESVIIDGYAYIRVAAITPGTFAEFDYEVRAAQNEDVKGIVFDLRDTSSGMFRDVYDMIDLLAPRGTIAKRVNSTGVVSVLATSDDEGVDLPMVALVNANTAGPGELFAVSLRDMCGGKIVGLRTGGHGTIQSVPQKLSDGSAISITIALLKTGRDEVFDGVGLEPDVEITFASDDEAAAFNPYNTIAMQDTQIKRSVDVLRSMVRERGGDPGKPTAPGNTPGTTLPPAIITDDSSLPPDSSLAEESGESASGQSAA